MNEVSDDLDISNHIDVVQATAYLQTGTRGAMENINIEREAFELEGSLLENMGGFDTNLPRNQDMHLDDFAPDYFKDFV